MHHMLIYSQILLCMRPVLSHKHGNLILHDKICFPAVIAVAGYRLPIPADCLQSSQGIPGEVAQTLLQQASCSIVIVNPYSLFYFNLDNISGQMEIWLYQVQ